MVCYYVSTIEIPKKYKISSNIACSAKYTQRYKIHINEQVFEYKDLGVFIDSDWIERSVMILCKMCRCPLISLVFKNMSSIYIMDALWNILEEQIETFSSTMVN